MMQSHQEVWLFCESIVPKNSHHNLSALARSVAPSKQAKLASLSGASRALQQAKLAPLSGVSRALQQAKLAPLSGVSRDLQASEACVLERRQPRSSARVIKNPC
jgi:hypothetical protein